jgi:protein O-mannosyl-transferase
VRRCLLVAVSIAAINVLWIALFGPYDFRLGPVHLAAHGLFKPLLYLCGALLAAALINSGVEEDRGWTPGDLWIALAILLIYLPSVTVSAVHNDWTHQADVVSRTTLKSLAELFVWRQPDGFYRPLVFLSLWIDARIFGDNQWGYHLQNIFFHVANSLLLIRVAVRLGLSEAASRWAALLFAVAAVNYEPVIWPGARFDLMAACFVLLALRSALGERVSLWSMSIFYVLAVLSKESAYCFPLLLVLFFVFRGKLQIMPVGIVAALSAVLLGIRWAIFHGMGGYPAEAGVEPHFALHLATFTSFFTRALPVPLFGLNTNDALAWWARVALAGFAVAACGYAAFCGGSLKTKLALLGAALLSALPAVNLVDWISPVMHNTRYLYMPGMWIFLLLSSAAANNRARVWFGLLVLANIGAAVYNYRVFVL